MKLIAPTRTNRGNFKCPFCPKTWKRLDESFYNNHIKVKHIDEIIKQFQVYKNKTNTLEVENGQLKRKLELAPKPKDPEPPKKEKEYYKALIFCTNCKVIWRANMPKGVLVSNVTCGNCGTQNVQLASNDSGFPI